MKAIINLPIVLIFLILISSCKKTDDNITPTLSINPVQKDVDANQGSFKIAVTSSVKWTASSDKSWVTIDPISGTGDGTAQVEYQLNTSATSRTAIITFKSSNVEDKAVTILQSGILPILTVSPANQSVSSVAGNTTINITSNLSWSATSNQTWCTLAQSSGIGNAALTLNYQANTIQSQRTAIITFTANGVTNQTVQITQAEFVPTLTITPPSQTVNSAQGTTTYTITSNIAWAATCSQGWCSIANPGGSNNGTLSVNYDQNTTSGSRVATIIVSGTGVTNQSVTLTQTNLIPTLTVTPSNRDVTSAAGSTTFDINSNSSWTAESDQEWCSITNTSGNGNATLNVNYEENIANTQRFATITILCNGISPKTVTVTQKSLISTYGLVAYYPFNGNANDDSGNGNNGTVNGATLTSDRKNNANRAYSFDGTNDNIQALNGIFGKTFSISVWIKNISTDASRHDFIDFGSNSNYQGFFLFIDDDKITCSISAVYGTFTSNYCAINEWHHCAVISSDGLVSLYMDNTFRSSFNFPTMNITGTNFNIGGSWNQWVGNTWYDGSIDDIRIYNRTLTEQEIQQLYNE